MGMTVRRLMASPTLGLSLAGGGAGIDRVITWAHAIELPDPRPWLSGGELVMTTGLQLPDDDAGQYQYLTGLAESGCAAVAFDTGCRFSQVPGSIREAADEVGIPVLAVAPTTPFIAISHAVIDGIARERMDLIRQTVQGQENLARATIHAGIGGLIKTLGAALNCSVCVIDHTGRVLGDSTNGRDDLLSRVHEQIHGNRTRSRAFVDDSGCLTIQQLRGAAGSQVYLAVASAAPLGPTERQLVSHAVSLLTIEVSKSARVVEAEQSLRTSVANALLYHGLDIDTTLLDYFGFAPESQVTVAAFTSLGPVPQAQHELTAALRQESTPYLMSALAGGGGIAIAVPADGATELLERVYHRARSGLRRNINGGMGGAVEFRQIKLSLQQAVSAARAAASNGHQMVAFEDLGTFSLLLSTQSDDVLRTIATGWLHAIEDHDRERGTRLLESLDSFLHHNGHWDGAASELGVHRHTLRKRIERVAELICRDMDSAHTRSELWIALKARELLMRGADQHQEPVTGIAG
ncbi:PucR family transcriptional regulator [Mycolicibacterium sphagni]|uniref:PucR family transcriptional regulator n=1 Tax=Mycolicibacterium sphagni TaxID=1786 RepID=A0ABX2JXA8_9MYCO|nr:PucR family transcriptional regulator [Mycolicibacterium sphagni]